MVKLDTSVDCAEFKGPWKDMCETFNQWPHINMFIRRALTARLLDPVGRKRWKVSTCIPLGGSTSSRSRDLHPLWHRTETPHTRYLYEFTFQKGNWIFGRMRHPSRDHRIVQQTHSFHPITQLLPVNFFNDDVFTRKSTSLNSSEANLGFLEWPCRLMILVLSGLFFLHIGVIWLQKKRKRKRKKEWKKGKALWGRRNYPNPFFPPEIEENINTSKAKAKGNGKRQNQDTHQDRTKDQFQSSNAKTRKKKKKSKDQTLLDWDPSRKSIQKKRRRRRGVS